MSAFPIQFDPATHRYYYNSERYLSATQIIGMVENEFNVKEQSIQMASRHGHSPEYWASKWMDITANSLEIGDELHATQEDFLLYRGLEVRQDGVIRVQNAERLLSVVGYDYMDWPDGVYPELPLWNHHYKLAGRADKVIFYTSPKTGKRYAHIDDYKSNKRIRKESWYDKDTGYRMLKEPLSHLMDCEYIRYSLQLSIYQFMLEQMGFRVGKRTLLHFEPLPVDLADYPGERSKKPTKYNLPYLRKDVVRLLNSITRGIPERPAYL